MKSFCRLNPLHKGKPSGIADRTDRKHSLHQKQRSSEQQHLDRREVIGERSKHPDPVKHPAHGQTAHRSHGQSGQQRDPHIVQALKGQHLGQLPIAHTYGLEHAELLLAGEKIGNQGISQVDEGKHKDKDQDAVVPGQNLWCWRCWWWCNFALNKIA